MVENRAIIVNLSILNRLEFFSSWLKILLKFYRSIGLGSSQFWLTVFLWSGRPIPSLSRLELCIPKITSLDFSVWIDSFHHRVDSRSAPLKSSFYFLCVSQPELSMGRLKPCAKSKMCVKIDSFYTRVNLTLLVISYKSAYSINKHNLTLLSSLIPIKHIWYKINDVYNFLTYQAYHHYINLLS